PKLLTTTENKVNPKKDHGSEQGTSNGNRVDSGSKISYLQSGTGRLSNPAEPENAKALADSFEVVESLDVSTETVDSGSREASNIPDLSKPS
ncbi:MAG: hypothetical protein ACRESZ_10985, partial [Methylococcales bacterium]